jgi:hypothetical protein
MKVRKSAGIILILFVLSLLSCGLGDKYSGSWSNETMDREILNIKKSDNGYTIDAGYGSFPCIKEDKILKCKMGFGDTVLHINEEGYLVMTTPVGVQFKFKQKK